MPAEEVCGSARGVGRISHLNELNLTYNNLNRQNTEKRTQIGKPSASFIVRMTKKHFFFIVIRIARNEKPTSVENWRPGILFGDD